MIKLTKGNLLKADVEALVNTVNSVGHMGKGIALQFKKAFPENFLSYQKAVRRNEVYPGRMFVFETGSMVNPKYIINFPTKTHWRSGSKLEYIESGLKALSKEISRLDIHSVAIPPLGSGLGGLSWDEVRPMIVKAFETLPHVDVLLFEPAGAPAAEEMPIGTRRPHLTLARALLIRLMKQYTELAYRLTLLEVQKVGYFLQESGESLRLRYSAGPYGPYAPNLNKVLETLEGHFISGYGDRQGPDVEIQLMTGAAEEAKRFLEKFPESRARLERVGSVIEGFETPYGMELLSSTHWVGLHGSPPARNIQDAVQAIGCWSERKRKMFRSNHIEVAWKRLLDAGWLTEDVANSHPIQQSWQTEFQMVNASEIDRFLHLNKDLLGILIEIPKQLRANVPEIQQILLEYDRDNEENFEGLFVRVRTTAPPETALDSLSSFDHKWWLSLSADIRQRLTILIEPHELQVDQLS